MLSMLSLSLLCTLYAVQASEFFQDWGMVKELCELLGTHLFNTAPEAGASFSTKHHIAEVRRGFHPM